uniref:Glutaredoxin domain-containing protein n=1 Tax=Parascaris univalens TaxID=6257 RepID=A0A915BP97_PARUN
MTLFTSHSLRLFDCCASQMVRQWIYSSIALFCSIAATGDGQRDASDEYGFRMPIYDYNKPALPPLTTYTATSPASSLLNQQSHVVFQRPFVNPTLHIDSYGTSFVQPSLLSRNTEAEVDYSSGIQTPLLSGYSPVSGSWQPTYLPPSSDKQIPSVGIYSSLSAKDRREVISSQQIPSLISNEYRGTSAPEIDDSHTTSQLVDTVPKYGIRMPPQLQQMSAASNGDQHVFLPDMSPSTQNGVIYPGQQPIEGQEGQGYQQYVVLPNDRLSASSQVAQIGINGGELSGGKQPAYPFTDSSMAGAQYIHSSIVPSPAVLPAYAGSNMSPNSFSAAAASELRGALMSVPPSNASRSEADERGKSTVAMLTQQILQLPAVIYMDSSDMEDKQIEHLLRGTYNLPLVAFYIDKLDNRFEVEGLLKQLTAYKGLPYIFICGKFVGSQEHLDNYHRNGQVAELVEKVCALNSEHSEHRSA